MPDFKPRVKFVRCRKCRSHVEGVYFSRRFQCLYVEAYCHGEATHFEVPDAETDRNPAEVWVFKGVGVEGIPLETLRADAVPDWLVTACVASALLGMGGMQ